MHFNFRSLLALKTVSLALLLAIAPFARGEDDPPSTVVEFYYTNEDPHLAATDKLLSDAMKKFPGFQFERISVDDKKGAKRLEKREKSLEIKNPGEMTMIFGPFYLTSKGTTRDIETYFVPMMERLVKQGKGDMSHKDRLKTDAAVAAYAKEIYGPDVTVIDPPAAAKFDLNIFYDVKKDGKRAGWIVDAYDPIQCPVCSGTQFLLAADQKGTIMGVKALREIERIGSPISDAETQKFVAQFKGKTPADEPVKVDGITRATKTVHAYTTAVNQILEELKTRAKE